MRFTAVIATILSMAAFTIAAPIANEGSLHPHGSPTNNDTDSAAEVAARQNHGMCVKSTGGQVEQIPNC